MLRVALLCLMAFFGNAAFACKCDSQGSFVQVLDWNFKHNPGRVIVLRGFVQAYGDQVPRSDGLPARFPQSMTVRVNQVHLGSVAGERVKVWGDDGGSCRPYVHNFPLGSEWIFVLHGGERFVGEQFSLSNCGTYWLKVDGSRVQGRITEPRTVQEMSIGELTKLLATRR